MSCELLPSSSSKVHEDEKGGHTDDKYDLRNLFNIFPT